MGLLTNQVANAVEDIGVDVKAVSPAAAGLRKSQEERSNVRREYAYRINIRTYGNSVSPRVPRG